MLGDHPACCFGGSASGSSRTHGSGCLPICGVGVCTCCGSDQCFCAHWARGGELERRISSRLARARACCRGEVGLLGCCSPLWGSPLACCYPSEGESNALFLSRPTWKCPSAPSCAVKVPLLGPHSSCEVGGGCFYQRWVEVFFPQSREGGVGRRLVQSCPFGYGGLLLPDPLFSAPFFLPPPGSPEWVSVLRGMGLVPLTWVLLSTPIFAPPTFATQVEGETAHTIVLLRL